MLKVLVLSSLLLLTACFESRGGGSGDAAGEAPGAPDTMQRGVDTPTSTADVALDVGAGVPCTTDAQCATLTQADLCQGPYRCIGWACTPDPSLAVTCGPSEGPCFESACDPSTGECATSMLDACICKPLGNLLCGQVREFSTADSGGTNVLQGYPCGPAGGSAGERTWIFESETTQQVKMALSSDAMEGLWVVGFDGKQCNTQSCIAGGKQGAAFIAQAGFKYAIVVESPEQGSVFSTLTSYCGLSDEVACDDGIDDNLDGLTDCADSSCSNKDGCPPATEVVCNDGEDDDLDGAIDCVDPDCASDAWCNETCIVDYQATCGTKDGRVSAEYAKDISNYSCGPEAGGYEVVYRFTSNTATQLHVTLDSGVESMGIYGLMESPEGCKPSNCLGYGKTELFLPHQPGNVIYVIVDSAKNSGGYYDIVFSCN